MATGIIAGYPIVDIRVSLYDGSYHDVDSSEMAFKIAGSLGFKKIFLEAKPSLLEPIMNIEVTIPEKYTGDVMGDINSRRGKVLGVETRGKSQIIKAKIPQAEILTYINDLTSMTSGKGFYTASFSHNEEIPAHLAQKIIEKHSKEKEESVTSSAH
jgi:elongation factor G